MLIGYMETLPKGEVAGGWGLMKDWISDWKRWSRAERCFAVALVILSLVIPLGFMIGGRMIGT
jgi:hypothetical protein